jgi:hypothetical protein
VSSSPLLLFWTGLVFWSLGQIWYAQIVIYPLFARVGEAEYRTYHGLYARRIPLPVIVPGFACFLAPMALAAFGPPLPGWLHAANIAGGLVALLVTVGLEIPRHVALERHGKNEHTIAELVRYNWPRTAAITVQAAATLSMLLRA